LTLTWFQPFAFEWVNDVCRYSPDEAPLRNLLVAIGPERTVGPLCDWVEDTKKPARLELARVLAEITCDVHEVERAPPEYTLGCVSQL
jgi:hypothetical protein